MKHVFSMAILVGLFFLVLGIVLQLVLRPEAERYVPFFITFLSATGAIIGAIAGATYAIERAIHYRDKGRIPENSP